MRFVEGEIGCRYEKGELADLPFRPAKEPRITHLELTVVVKLEDGDVVYPQDFDPEEDASQRAALVEAVGKVTGLRLASGPGGQLPPPTVRYRTNLPFAPPGMMPAPPETEEEGSVLPTDPGLRLQVIRLQRRLSVEQLADRAGLRRETVRRVEECGAVPDESVVYKLAKGLAVSELDLYFLRGGR